MTARALMVLGTASGVGKSILVTGLCRLFARRGLRVAPFKAQNLSLNAGVTPAGEEISRSVLAQAEAAGVVPSALMNPVLIKPERGRGSQVVLEGRVWGNIDRHNWQEVRTLLWERITAAYDRLRRDHDLILLEGAGSPAEINLKATDLVNLRMAEHAGAPALLVGSIDRGGVFASLVGTLVLLEPEERERIRGLVINRLDGDPALLGDAPERLRELAFGIPTLGVIPHLEDIGVAEEDALGLDRSRQAGGDAGGDAADRALEIAVIRLPHLSNFDDFDPLGREPGVVVRYVGRRADLGEPAAVILPGSKLTLRDLAWLEERGLAEAVRALAVRGTAVVGLCGGYQMLGERLRDPEGVEAEPGSEARGLGLLPVETVFTGAKETRRVTGRIEARAGAFSELAGMPVTGYEIHRGRSRPVGGGAEGLESFCRLDGALRGEGGEGGREDGLVAAEGRVWGTYLHGVFEEEAFRRGWLRSLGWSGGARGGENRDREAAYDRLADHLEAHLDLATLEEIIGLS